MERGERLPEPPHLVLVQRPRGHATQRLPFEQLAEKLDDDQDEVGESALNRFRIRLETRREAVGSARGSRERELARSLGADRREQRLESQLDQVDPRDRDGHVAAGGHAGVDQAVEQVDEAGAQGSLANEYGGQGPLIASS